MGTKLVKTEIGKNVNKKRDRKERYFRDFNVVDEGRTTEFLNHGTSDGALYKSTSNFQISLRSHFDLTSISLVIQKMSNEYNKWVKVTISVRSPWLTSIKEITYSEDSPALPSG